MMAIGMLLMSAMIQIQGLPGPTSKTNVLDGLLQDRVRSRSKDSVSPARKAPRRADLHNAPVDNKRPPLLPGAGSSS